MLVSRDLDETVSFPLLMYIKGVTGVGLSGMGVLSVGFWLKRSEV